jgi:hypothetical protein
VFDFDYCPAHCYAVSKDRRQVLDARWINGHFERHMTPHSEGYDLPGQDSFHFVFSAIELGVFSSKPSKRRREMIKRRWNEHVARCAEYFGVDPRAFNG